MSNPQNRLAMFHGHLKFQSESDLQPEFPMVSRHERSKYVTSNFQSKRPDFAAKCHQLNISPTGSSKQPLIKTDQISFPLITPALSRSTSPSINQKSTSDSAGMLDRCVQKIEILFGAPRAIQEHAIIVSPHSGYFIKMVESIVSNNGGNILYMSVGAHSQNLEFFRSRLSNSDIKVTSFRLNPMEIIDSNLLIETLQSKFYSVVIMDHVSETLGVLLDISGLSRCIRKQSPNTILALDTSNSSGVQEIQADLWGLDLVFKEISIPSPDGDNSGASFSYVSKKCIDGMQEKLRDDLARNQLNLDPECLSGTSLYLDRVLGSSLSNETMLLYHTSISEYKVITLTLYNHILQHFDILPAKLEQRVNHICAFLLNDEQKVSLDFPNIEKELGDLGINFNHAYSDEFQRYYMTLNFEGFELTKSDNEKELQELVLEISFILTPVKSFIDL